MTNNNLGQYLRKLRKSCGYTQEFVASHLNISRQAYSHYETNRAIPPIDACYQIANLYNVSADSIIKLSLRPDIEHPESDTPDALDHFLDYLENDENKKKIKNLNHKERELLYYYWLLPAAEQDEIVEILKIKVKKCASTQTSASNKA